MATVGEAIAATLIAQWSGVGGTQPDPIQCIVERPENNPNPTVVDAIYVWLPLGRTFDPVDLAEVYRNVTYTIRIECHTKTSSARQLEIENEVDRILNSGAPITGATRQRVLEINDISNRSYSNLPKYISEVIVEVFTSMEISGTAYGTSTTSTVITDDLTVNISFGGNAVLDEDNMVSDSDTKIATQQSIKAYVDTAILTEDTLAELNDTTIAGLADNHILTYDNGTSKWINEPQSVLTGITSSSGSFEVGGDLTVLGGDIHGTAGSGDLSIHARDDLHFYVNENVSQALALTLRQDTVALFPGDIYSQTGGIYAQQDNTGLYTGNGNEMRLYHDGSHSYITTTTGDLYLDPTGGQVYIDCELDLTGANVWIDLNPAGTGSRDIISIAPTAALVAGSTWNGVKVIGNALDPATGTASTIYGFYAQFNTLVSADNDATVYGFRGLAPSTENSYMFSHNLSVMTVNKEQRTLFSYMSGALNATATYQGVFVDWDAPTRTGGAPVLQGVRVQLPTDYTDFGTCYAGYFSGNGRSVSLCDTSNAIDVTGDGGATGLIDINPSGTGTQYVMTFWPSAALAQGSTWRGIDMELGSLDPATGTACTVHGVRINAATMRSVDHDGVFYGYLMYGADSDNSTGFYYSPGEMVQNKTTTGFYSYLSGAKSVTATYQGLHLNWSTTTRDANAPVLKGINVALPADYTGFGASYAGYFHGDGRSVTICNTDWSLLTVGSMYFGNGNILQYNTNNDGNPYFYQGSRSADKFYHQAVYKAGTVVLDYTLFRTDSTDAGVNDGRFEFYPDNVKALTLFRSGNATVAAAFTCGAGGFDVDATGNITDCGNITMAGTLGTVTNLTMTGTIATPTTITTSGNITCGGDVRVNGSEIKDSAGTTRITLGSTTIIGGDIQVNGNDIKDAGGNVILSSGGTGFIDTLGAIGCNITVSINPKYYDIATSLLAFDECYADNWNNVSSWKTFADPLAVLRTIGPREDDEYAIDHSNINDWLGARVKAKIKNEKGGLEWEGGYVLKTEKASPNARKVYVERLGKEVYVGNYSDGYVDEDFEHEEAYSINKTQVVLIQAMAQLKEENDSLKSLLTNLEGRINLLENAS